MGFLFNCTLAGRTSDSMEVLTKDLFIEERVGPGAASFVRPTWFGFLLLWYSVVYFFCI